LVDTISNGEEENTLTSKSRHQNTQREEEENTLTSKSRHQKEEENTLTSKSRHQNTQRELNRTYTWNDRGKQTSTPRSKH
jgi:hypothetical protein